MYTSKAASPDVMKSIEGFDVFNSKFIYNIDNASKSSYLITRYEERPDLLAEDIYERNTNYGLLMIINRMKHSDMTIGKILNYIDNTNLAGLR